MSYILDALRKSDQQRQRGVAPTLQSVQVVVAPSRTLSVSYGLLAAIMLVAALIAGWMQATRQPASEGKPVILKSPVVNPPAVMQTEIPKVVPSALPVSTAHPDDRPASNAILAFEELPPAIRQEIPSMTVQLHVYSGKASERMVSINSSRLREGDFLTVGLRLEQITREGMVFSYKGYRFRHGLR